MADKFSLNYATAATNHPFSAVWRLTRVMKAAGWNVVAHSDGITKTAAGTNNNDSWGNNADPMNDTYPAFDTPAAWIVMQGPSTVKLMITSAPSGIFVRGEQVTQASTSATGEILGIVWDSNLMVGWAIIQPRTGTFNGSSMVTGAISSATFTPSSIKTFTREVVFAKQSSSVFNGSSYYICAEASAESAQLFSTLAASAGCTAIVQPGAGGTGNAFPTLGICVRGNGGIVSHTQWFYAATTNFTGFANLVCTNTTSSANVSADGSFYCLVGRGDFLGVQGMFGFFRIDDGEPGDVDPYVWYWANGTTLGSFNRTTATSYPSTQYESWVNIGGAGRTYAVWRGYAARDGYVTARDVVVPFVFTYRNTSYNVYLPQMNSAQPNAMEVQNQPSSNLMYVREPLGLCTTGQTSSIRMVKGNIRWINVVPIGAYKDTFDGQKWITLVTWAHNVNPGIIIGPWDGSTIPA